MVKPTRIFFLGKILLCGVFFTAAFCSGKSFADIYFYVDKDGVRHFSNAPTSGNYRFFMSEDPQLPGAAVVSILQSYDDAIMDAAAKYDLDFSLIKAVIKAESAFDRFAVSPKGAMGLMQLMPDTARLMRVTDPFDARQNIMGGARYLKAQLNHYDGDLSLALAAYNAGPTTVDRYQKIPPFKETRRYVQQVLSYYNALKTARR